MAVIAVVGAATAIFAATMGITGDRHQEGPGVLDGEPARLHVRGRRRRRMDRCDLHLMTHAFFKALLFLGAGSVIHGQHGEQDITKMGGLRSKLPVTFATFLTATLAIAGVFPLAGFFSKDEILWGAWSSGHTIVWAVLALSAG
jgi:NADH-quinone oxidoreductase subunit L